MQEEDWNEFVNLFSEVCHAFSTEKSSATRAVYWQYLKPFSIEDIGEAIKNLIIARELFPAISPILKEASRSNANNYSRAICYRNPYHDKGGKIKNSERG